MKSRFACLVLASFLQLNAGAQLSMTSLQFKEYKKINDTEMTLNEFRDSDSDLLLKLNQLEIINVSRAKHKAPPVKLDILASRVANKMCMQSAAGRYISHWNEEGEKPYHRYAFAGGHDHVTENASGESFSGEYNTDNITRAEMMNKYHQIFMAEKAPANGHKLNIIDKNHNFVGIGFYLDKNEFRYYEEFIDRYLKFYDIPTVVKRNDEFNIRVETMPGSYLCYLTAYYEKELQKRSITSLRRTGSYPDYSDVIASEINPVEISSYRNGQEYTIPLKFSKPGLYYIHIYIDNKVFTGGSFTTEGKILASGLVIRVI